MINFLSSLPYPLILFLLISVPLLALGITAIIGFTHRASKQQAQEKQRIYLAFNPESKTTPLGDWKTPRNVNPDAQLQDGIERARERDYFPQTEDSTQKREAV